MSDAAAVNGPTGAGFGLFAVWLVFVPCILLSVVSTILILLVMGAGMGSSMTPAIIQLPVLVVAALVFLLPAMLVSGIWQGWGAGTARRKWLIGAALLLGLLCFALGVERIIRDNGDWFLHLPLWVCGLPLFLSAIIAARQQGAQP